MADHHVLYRMFDKDGELLYVGMTSDPGKRMYQHKTSKGWWKDIADISLEHFSSRAEAAAAERDAIKTEQPQWNMVRFNCGEKLRAFRISNELWQATKARAAENGETVSDVLRRELEIYIKEDA